MRVLFGTGLLMLGVTAGCQTCVGLGDRCVDPVSACGATAEVCAPVRGGTPSQCESADHRVWSAPGAYVPSIDDPLCRWQGRCAADEALERLEEARGREFGEDFKEGFEQAFEDLAMGYQPVPPTTPPSRYWKAAHRSPRGRTKAANWYAGYTAGLEAGLARGWGDQQVPLAAWTSGAAAAPPAGSVPPPRPLWRAIHQPSPPSPAAGLQPPRAVP